MEAFKTVIWIINIFSSLAIIALVLMQHGKGADAGASFGGSGSAQGVFGSSGNANFLTRMTAISAIIFFASCLALGYVNTKSSHKVGGLDFSNVQQTQTASQPAALPATPAMESVKPQSASAEAASEVKADVSGAAIAAGAGAAAATAKVVADKVSDKKAEAKASSKKAESDKKKSSSKPATKTEKKKTEKSSK